MKKSTNSIKSNICKYLLIPIIVIIDIIMLIVITPLTDGKTYSDHKGVYTYDELFSSKTEGADMKDMISFSLFSGNILHPVNANTILDGVEFVTVSHLITPAIMVLYNPNNEIFALSTRSSGPVLDVNEVSDEIVFEISKATGYVVYGTLFTFCGDIYMFANIKDDTYVYDENSTPRENAVRSTYSSHSKTIALFKLCNVDESFIEENFSVYNAGSYIKYYPEWYEGLQYFWEYRVIAAILFIIQFPIAFKIYSKVITPKTESNKKKKAKK